MVSIVLVDDHKMVRECIRKLLEASQFNVVGEADSGDEAVKLATELQPDILVTDLCLPDADGIEVIRKVRSSSPKTKIIILSMYDMESYVHSALAAGAKGFVSKLADSAELIKAIRAALEGKNFLSPDILK